MTLNRIDLMYTPLLLLLGWGWINPYAVAVGSGRMALGTRITHTIAPEIQLLQGLVLRQRVGKPLAASITNGIATKRRSNSNTKSNSDSSRHNNSNGKRNSNRNSNSHICIYASGPRAGGPPAQGIPPRDPGSYGF